MSGKRPGGAWSSVVSSLALASALSSTLAAEGGSFAATDPTLEAPGPVGPVTPAEKEWAGAKLRTYCQACHGVGALRFIRSDSNSALWSYLFSAKAPNSGKLWKDGIIEVLAWPSDAPPAADRPMDPAHGRDWMPKGGKRTTFAADKVGGTQSRRLLLELLRREP